MIKPIKTKAKTKANKIKAAKAATDARAAKAARAKAKIYNNFLLIGNSSNVLDFEYGKEIDKFKTVARMNIFKINGYEKYIGKKIDVWVRNGYYKFKLETPYNFNKIFICDTNKYGINLPIPANDKRYIITNKKHIQKTIDLYNFKIKNKITTGMFFILWYLSQKKYKKPLIIYGFSFFYEDRDKDHHYFGDSKRQARMFDKRVQEREMIKTLIKEKKVIFLNDFLKQYG